MKETVLLEAQRVARVALSGILKRGQGAILRGDEGTGKTWIAAEIASQYDKILFIGKAGALPDIKSKIIDYEIASGNKLNMDFISYHGLPHMEKIPSEKLREYDLFIFDEFHELRNYKAAKTQRYVKMRKGKFLHLSGTPMLKSPKDLVYVLRKCGLYKSTEEFYQRYFDAKPSKYGDFKELGEFRNEIDFQTNLDQVCVELSHKDIDKDMPDIKFEVHQLPGKYTPPKDITTETATRIKAGKSKVKGATKHIRKKLMETGQDRALILCFFHDTAKAVAKELMINPSLTPKNVREDFKKLEREGGIIVTTLGLTSSSLDLNSCDIVFLVESTYSYPLDRQSIRRCQRIGKKNELVVHYYTLEGEHSVIKSFSRKYLTENMKRSKMSPSQLGRLEVCPGSYWLPANNFREEYVESASILGTNMHTILERYLNNPRIPILSGVPDDIMTMIHTCRKRIKECDQHGIESRVDLLSVHPDLVGTVDFWAYDKKSKILHVTDYKNGVTPVRVHENAQLIAYTLMIIETYQLNVLKINHRIIQKNTIKSCYYDSDVLQSWRERIQNIVNNVMAAKDNPLQHLNKNECDFFCPAGEYHSAQEELPMANYKKSTKKKKKLFKVEGEVFFTKKHTSKNGNEVLTVGITFADVPESFKGVDYKKGSRRLKILQHAVKKDENRDDQRSIFTMGLTEDIVGEQKVSRGDIVEAKLDISIPDEDAEYQNATFWLKNIAVIKSAVADEGEEDGGEAEADTSSDDEVDEASWDD